MIVVCVILKFHDAEIKEICPLTYLDVSNSAFRLPREQLGSVSVVLHLQHLLFVFCFVLDS